MPTSCATDATARSPSWFIIRVNPVGANANGRVEPDAEDVAAGVDLGDVAQHARPELDAGERGAGAAQAELPVGGAVGVVEHRARGAPPGDGAQVGDAGRARAACGRCAFQTNGAGRSSGPSSEGRGSRRCTMHHILDAGRGHSPSGERVLHPECGDRRRSSSNAATAAALATLSDSTPPCMGMASMPSSSARTSADSPSVSLPSTSATRPGSSAVEQRRPARVQPEHGEPRRAQRRAALLGGARAQHRRPERHPGRRLDHQRVDRRHPAAGEQHPVEPGGGGAAQHHPDVGRVRDAVQHEHRGRRRRSSASRNSATGAIRGATTSASTPWS